MKDGWYRRYKKRPLDNPAHRVINGEALCGQKLNPKILVQIYLKDFPKYKLCPTCVEKSKEVDKT